VILSNPLTQVIIANKVEIADNPLSRMKGLLGRKSLVEGEALVITGCNSIHMFFMCFAIDVIFVDRNWMVVGLTRRIKPFGLSPIFWRAEMAIELVAGSIDRTGVGLGQKLCLAE